MASLDDAMKIVKSGRLREGMEILENLVANDPENVNVLYNLGMCYSELGRIDESIETLERCVGLAPEHANALTALGFSYSRQGEYEKALGKLKLALESDPDNFHAIKNQGAIFAKLGRYQEAIMSLEKANRLAPDSPEILYGLGLAYKEKGDRKAADELFKKIITADKDTKITELAKTERREIALEWLKSRGFRIDAVTYCLGALELFSSKGRNEIFTIASEIVLLARRGLEPVTGKDLRKHFSGCPSIITTGIQLYETLGDEDTGYPGDLRVTNEWAKILKISDWLTWIGFEDMPESYFTDI